MSQDTNDQQVSLSDEINLKEIVQKGKALFSYLKSKWKILFLAGLIGGIAGFSYAYIQKINYKAVLTFALEDEKGGGGALSGTLGIANSLGFDVGGGGGGAFSGSNLTALMKSRRLVEQALLSSVTQTDGKIITLAEMYLFFNNWRNEWKKNDPSLDKKLYFEPGTDRQKFSLQQDSILGIIYSKLIKENLTIEQKDKKVSIISIEVKTQNELFSKFFAEALAKKVSEFYIETKSRKSRINVSILEKQADSIRAELNAAITGVAVANDNAYNLNPAYNIKRTPSSRRQIDVQANTAILTELIKNLELARVTLRRETPLIQTIDFPILPLVKEKPSKLMYMIRGGVLLGIVILIGLILQRWLNEVLK